MAGFVQVFGRRQGRALHALMRPASEKRQGCRACRVALRATYWEKLPPLRTAHDG
jgi:hypothetical protein